jgi:hypothetical protein
MIEEYARRNGHADLLPERIDGRLGRWPPMRGGRRRFPRWWRSGR